MGFNHKNITCYFSKLFYKFIFGMLLAVKNALFNFIKKEVIRICC